MTDRRTLAFGRALALAALFAAQPALGSPCTIDTARYSQPDGGATLQFLPYDLPTPFPVSASTTNLFIVSVPDMATQLWGSVGWNQGLSRPVGRLGFPCGDPAIDPEVQDEFGDYPDIPFCALWSGVAYALVDSGIALLPGEGNAAPQQVLLTDLARTLRYGDFAFPEDAVLPETGVGTQLYLDDVFTLDGC